MVKNVQTTLKDVKYLIQVNRTRLFYAIESGRDPQKISAIDVQM